MITFQITIDERRYIAVTATRFQVLQQTPLEYTMLECLKSTINRINQEHAIDNSKKENESPILTKLTK